MLARHSLVVFVATLQMLALYYTLRTTWIAPPEFLDHLHIYIYIYNVGVCVCVLDVP